MRQLRDGQEIAPELYDSVSLMFSDIPQFEAISLHCIPTQVIAFLNSFYPVIDEVLSRYNVYKVETVRDCYVVSDDSPYTVLRA